MTTTTWQTSWQKSVIERLEALDWRRVVADVGPFLERDDDVALVTREHAVQLVRSRRR